MNGLQSLVLRTLELSGVGTYDDRGSYRPASNRTVIDPPTASTNDLSFRPVLYVSP